MAILDDRDLGFSWFTSKEEMTRTEARFRPSRHSLI
jgi:hypothetical protein